MSDDQSVEVEQLQRKVAKLEAENKRLKGVLKAEGKTGLWLTKIGYKLYFGRDLTKSITAWREAAQEQRWIPGPETDELIAAIIRRWVWRISLIALIAVVPTVATLLLLMQQNSIVQGQNTLLQSQIDQQAKLDDLNRRAELLAILYDRTECDKDNREDCPLKSSNRARFEAAMAFVAIERSAKVVQPNLRQVNFIEANMNGIVLTQTNLSESNLISATLYAANLSGANLFRANLSGAGLWKADLQGADLWGADLSGADLWEADLSGADLSRANLAEAHLVEADLEKANLSLANLRGVRLSGANLREARLRGAILEGADLFADLWQADPWGADLSGTDLSGADLWEADLSGANLSYANLAEVNLEGANLNGATLKGAKYTIDTIWPEGFDPEKYGAILVEE